MSVLSVRDVLPSYLLLVLLGFIYSFLLTIGSHIPFARLCYTDVWRLASSFGIHILVYVTLMFGGLLLLLGFIYLFFPSLGYVAMIFGGLLLLLGLIYIFVYQCSGMLHWFLETYFFFCDVFQEYSILETQWDGCRNKARQFWLSGVWEGVWRLTFLVEAFPDVGSCYFYLVYVWIYIYSFVLHVIYVLSWYTLVAWMNFKLVFVFF